MNARKHMQKEQGKQKSKLTNLTNAKSSKAKVEDINTNILLKINLYLKGVT